MTEKTGETRASWPWNEVYGQSCENCRFFKPATHGDHCRRYPPKVTGVSVDVEADEWCGEFKDARYTE